MIEVIFGLGLPFVLLIVGWIVGGARERTHFDSLERFFLRSSCLLTEVKSFPGGAESQRGAELVTAEVVVAEDYLKSFLAGLRAIFGGEIKSYQTLMYRARQEVTRRLVESAERDGYDAVCNIRIDFVRIGLGFAVLASGTAYRRTAIS